MKKILFNFKRFITKNIEYLFILFIGIVVIFLSAKYVYEDFINHSIVFSVTTVGFIVSPICVSMHEHKINNFNISDGVYYSLMQVVLTMGLFGTLIVLIDKNINEACINKYWGIVVSVSILFSERLSWKSFRTYVKNKIGIDLLNKKYHNLYISTLSKLFTVMAFITFLVSPYYGNDDKETNVVLSIGCVFCMYDLVLGLYNNRQNSISGL